MGDNSPLKELSIDIYSNTHLNSRETVPLNSKLNYRFTKNINLAIANWQKPNFIGSIAVG